MNTSPEPTRSDLQLAARRLGELAGHHVGDFFDIVEEIARGYAEHLEPTPKSFRNQHEHDQHRERRVRLQLNALNEMQLVARDVIEWRVDDARELRMSWQQIGDALEMSRQAAQQRYGKPTAEDVAAYRYDQLNNQ
jgi:hypothetical protein